MADAETKPPVRKPFAAIIQEQGNGSLHDKLSDSMAEVVRGVTEHGKAGELTLKLKVKDAGEGQILLNAEIKAKVPDSDAPAALFFTDEDGNLSRRDPRQIEMPLRQVGGEKEAG